MSRSRKKVGGYYITRIANKPKKRAVERKQYNRKWRRVNKHRLISGKPLIDKHDEVADLWSMLQDGNYIKSPNPIYKRK